MTALHSKIVVLADGYRTPVQHIGTAATNPTLPLTSIFYLHCFNLLSVSKITKVLNCTVTFFWHIFQELETRKILA